MASVVIVTYGCAVNKADSEIIAGLLAESGHNVITNYDSIEPADVFVVNTCAVKLPTENKIIRKLREMRGKRVVVAGCLPLAVPDVVDKFPQFSFIGTNIADIADAVGEALKNKRYVNVSRSRGTEKVSLPKNRSSPVIGIIPISEGCIGNCAYCSVKLARGNLVSYPLGAIVDNVKNALRGGAKEIWLTSQDTGAYGSDIGMKLPEMLEAVCRVEGDFFVRLGMTNPEHLRDFLDDMVGIYKNEKMYKFLHIPVQSGSNAVLKGMGRKYRAEDFRSIVEAFRKEIKDITVSTDVIVGYPTESAGQFDETADLIRSVEPEVINISRYWPRPLTRASELKPLPGGVTKERSKKMMEIFEGYAREKNRKWIGWKGRVLVSAAGIARNFAYKPIVVDLDETYLGREIEVEIFDATCYDLRGRKI